MESFFMDPRNNVLLDLHVLSAGMNIYRDSIIQDYGGGLVGHTNGNALGGPAFVPIYAPQGNLQQTLPYNHGYTQTQTYEFQPPAYSSPDNTNTLGFSKLTLSLISFVLIGLAFASFMVGLYYIIFFYK